MKILMIKKTSDNSYYFTCDGEISDPFFSKDRGLDYIITELLHDRSRTVEHALVKKLIIELWDDQDYPICIKFPKEGVFVFEKRIEKLNKDKEKLLKDLDIFCSMPKKSEEELFYEKCFLQLSEELCIPIYDKLSRN